MPVVTLALVTPSAASCTPMLIYTGRVGAESPCMRSNDPSPGGLAGGLMKIDDVVVGIGSADRGSVVSIDVSKADV